MGLQDNFKALKSISVEELQEQAEETDYLTPREFAKLIGVHPQQVYALIRKGTIKDETCKCGRTVVCVSESRAKLAKKQAELGRVVDPKYDPRYQSDEERNQHASEGTVGRPEEEGLE